MSWEEIMYLMRSGQGAYLSDEYGIDYAEELMNGLPIIRVPDGYYESYRVYRLSKNWHPVPKKIVNDLWWRTLETGLWGHAMKDGVRRRAFN